MKPRLAILFTTIFLLIAIETIFAQQKIERWSRFEITLKLNYSGNDFNDVQLSAKFTGNDTTYTVNGFYDGDNNYKIRFMPTKLGKWEYTTKSSVAGLNNKKGTFICVEPSSSNHGMVRVSNTYGFKYDDSTRYYPFGTTIYAWTNMKNELQELTLNTLKSTGFNKVRMCVFPKSYDMVKEEPEIYPYKIKETKKDSVGNEVKIWDFDSFNPAFFQHLEKRIDDLNELGIEADLILFHPYDDGRWGFDAMPIDASIRYVQYMTARLSSFRNVWWSLANEYDYIKAKSNADWDLISKTVACADPYRHLCSIHGSTATYYAYWKPEFTHVSIQDNAPVEDFGRASILRNVYRKPIIYDEVNYEGNLTRRWGQLSGEEMLHLVWQGIIAGTYVTHGEVYLPENEGDTYFWADGGKLKGTSWKRIQFLRNLLEQGPGPFELADISRDYKTATAGNGYYIIYFGKEIKDSWQFNLPAKNSNFDRIKPGTKFRVEIIDTWEMTIKPCPLEFETTSVIDYRVYDINMKNIRLPLKPYVALRITEIK